MSDQAHKPGTMQCPYCWKLISSRNHAHIKVCPQQPQWQPIETAPKGQFLDLLDGSLDIWADCFWCHKGYWVGVRSGATLEVQPTHWMPSRRDRPAPVTLLGLIKKWRDSDAPHRYECADELEAFAVAAAALIAEWRKEDDYYHADPMHCCADELEALVKDK